MRTVYICQNVQYTTIAHCVKYCIMQYNQPYGVTNELIIEGLNISYD